MDRIRLGIFGYGNLGRGVEKAIEQNEDMELVAVFSRRAKSGMEIKNKGARLEMAGNVDAYIGKIDVLLVCAGSAGDLPHLSPSLAEKFCIVDSFDTHASINEHFERVDSMAKKGKKLALIACGWDPGLFSLARLYSLAFIPQGNTNSFWGKGISQGHSEAIRRIDGVLDARQYTIPIPCALDLAKNESVSLRATEAHRRECFVVAADGADRAEIERKIITMPNYFSGYETSVHFISQEELNEKHSGYPHGGSVIRHGRHEDGAETLMELSLRLESNPDFTASVLVSFARAVSRLFRRGESGARTVFDIAPSDLLNITPEKIRKNLL